MRSTASEGRLFLQKNRLITGILLIALAAALALVLLPRYLDSRQTAYPVLTVSHDVAAGSVILESDLSLSKTVDKTLSEMAFTEIGRAAGKSATRNLQAGDYLFLNDAADGYIPPTIYNTLPDGYLMISVSVTSLSQSVSGQIRAGDIVRIYTADENGRAATPRELQYVKVLAVYDTEGKELFTGEASAARDDDVRADGGTLSDSGGIPAVISLLVDQEQALKAVELEKTGFLYFSLVSRDDDEASEEYLSRQRQTLAGRKGGYAD